MPLALNNNRGSVNKGQIKREVLDSFLKMLTWIRGIKGKKKH